MNSVSWLAWKIILTNFVIPLFEIRVYLYICTWCILHHFEGNTEGHIFLNIQIKMTLIFNCTNVFQYRSPSSCIRTWRTYLIQSQGAPTLCCHQIEPLQEGNVSLRLEGSVWGTRYPQKEPLCSSDATMVKCPLSLLKWAVGSHHACDPCCSSTLLPPLRSGGSCSYYSWLLPRVNRMHLFEVEDIITTAWHLKIKLCLEKTLEEGGRRCLSTGGVCLWLLYTAAWRSSCQVGEPCLHTASVAFPIFVSLSSLEVTLLQVEVEYAELDFYSFDHQRKI